MSQDGMDFIKEGLNFDLGDLNRPILSGWDVVGGLVHQFVADVFECYKCTQRGMTDRDTAIGEIEEQAKLLGDIFMGRNPAYVASSWYAEDRLGAVIRQQEGISFKATADPGEAFFRWLSVQAINAAKELDNGGSPQEVGPRLQETMRGAIKFLMGIGERP